MALKQLFRRAVRLGHCTIDPTEYIKLPPRSQKREIAFFSNEELATLFEYFDTSNPDYAPIIRFMYFTGLRRKETIRLKWKDLDIERMLISIKNSKSSSSNAIIPINIYAHDILTSLEIAGDNEYVFVIPVPTATTLMRRADALSRAFVNALEATGIEGHLHMLRHTFATQLAHSGVDMPSLKGLLRHSSVKTTEIYVHNIIEHLRNAVNSLPVNKISPPGSEEPKGESGR